MFLAAAAGNTTITVFTTAARILPDVNAVNITNSGGTNTINVAGGDVGFAAELGQVATVTTLKTPKTETNTVQPPVVTLGSGVTFTTADIDGGTVDAHCAVTTLGMTGGAWRHWAGNVTTITCDGGTVYLRAANTVATATFRGERAKLDCSGDPRAITITNHTFINKAVMNDPNKNITWTNAGTWTNDSVVLSNFGQGQFSLQRT